MFCEGDKIRVNRLHGVVKYNTEQKDRIFQIVLGLEQKHIKTCSNFTTFIWVGYKI